MNGRNRALVLCAAAVLASSCGQTAADSSLQQAGAAQQPTERAARPAPNERVDESQLAGVQRRRPDDHVADIAAVADEAPRHVRLAAYISSGQPCIALVRPAPGLVVCQTGEADLTQMIATGTRGPVEGGDGTASVFFGWGPSGTAAVRISSGEVSREIPVYDGGKRYDGRAFFVTEFLAPKQRVEFESLDASGAVISRRVLGG